MSDLPITPELLAEAATAAPEGVKAEVRRQLSAQIMRHNGDAMAAVGFIIDGWAAEALRLGYSAGDAYMIQVCITGTVATALGEYLAEFVASEIAWPSGEFSPRQP